MDNKNQEGWSLEQIETILNCPICDSNQNKETYSGLTDKNLFGIPGVWNLFTCLNCKSAYLNPRPDRNSINLAYQNYYTHAGTEEKDRMARGGIKEKIRNGYLNKRFGYNFSPSLPIGFYISFLFPIRRARSERIVRHLPCKPGSHLLDLGCGDGSFLDLMRETGWNVSGIDIDPVALALATGKGINVVEGNFDENIFPDESFDAITLNHVLEHLHDPIKTLDICKKTLRPGGVLWIATPNFQSLGSRKYQSFWRGLEPPRHLCIFNFGSLTHEIQRLGYTNIKVVLPHYRSEWMSKASFALANGINPNNGNISLPVLDKIYAQVENWISCIQYNLSEEIVLLAEKPI